MVCAMRDVLLCRLRRREEDLQGQIFCNVLCFFSLRLLNQLARALHNDCFRPLGESKNFGWVKTIVRPGPT